jgi:hypothetical protein
METPPERFDLYEYLLLSALRDLEATLVHLGQDVQLLGLRAERHAEASREARTDFIGVFCISPRRGIFQQYDPLTKTNASI